MTWVQKSTCLLIESTTAAAVRSRRPPFPFSRQKRSPGAKVSSNRVEPKYSCSVVQFFLSGRGSVVWAEAQLAEGGSTYALATVRYEWTPRRGSDSDRPRRARLRQGTWPDKGIPLLQDPICSPGFALHVCLSLNSASHLPKTVVLSTKKKSNLRMQV